MDHARVLNRRPVCLEDTDPLTGVPVVIRREQVQVVEFLDQMKGLDR
jgi:hypothetical protein